MPGREVVEAVVKTRVLALWNRWAEARGRALLPLLSLAEATPLDLRFVGRTITRVVLVGVACGLVGAAFFGALELVQRLLFEQLAGYVPLRASGEGLFKEEAVGTFRPWLLVLLPAIGGVLCGLVTRLAPEARGGGGDVMIEAFHHKGAILRRRVIGVKALASICTLGTGGAGGREGPTMLIGGAIGSAVARFLNVPTRERRVLLIAGVAAGISAVFRTPLGAAILAVEVLYRDGFESEALVPAVLASVVGYSVVISIYGESTLLAHSSRFPFVASHLPLYALLALMVALLAVVFVASLQWMRGLFASLPVPLWARPGVGGLALGILATPIIVYIGPHIGGAGRGLGIFGGGYGAAQTAITGAPWLPAGWEAVVILLLLAVMKIGAASLTIGSGGSAGDFAPSLAIGAMAGGAFGRSAQLLLDDPRLDPGAFALVGMGVFFGGIAHTPLSALVLVCEMAGNYDLLVPLMLALGIAYVALRKTTLYDAQVPSPRESPVHRDTALRDLLRAIRVRDVPGAMHGWFPSFEPKTTAAEMLAKASALETGVDVFPVLDPDGRIKGVVRASALRLLAREHNDTPWAIAADVMEPPVMVLPEDDLRTASERMVASGLRALPIVDAGGRAVGLLDEGELTKIYLRAAARAEDTLAPEPSRHGP